ncbi:hypothetical protein [Pelagicoccus sp. SDUM812002]|uniref:hypothetical protein n=1 Tax=Pelagicoccus sp. SDUM812002 TaxID=3041266 RepID=UPI00280CB258|nr:hypothetical protein [Pelagicoccus sp. SDUM812002]MDQ8186265.1 hypothetical protein [Pelagicoccus sp. SDUM812002]
MEEEPKEPSKVKTVYLPLAIASAFALVLWIGMPELGVLAIGSAWFGTVLFMSLWGAFYS